MSNPEHLKQIKSVADAYAQIKNAERERAVEQAQVEQQPTEAPKEQPLEEDADLSIGAVQKPKGANAFKKVQKGFPNRAIAGRALDKARKVEEFEIEEGMKMDDPKLLKMFDKLKKGSKIKLKTSSTINKGKDFVEYLVKAKTFVNKGKVEKITLVTVGNEKAVKKFLYKRDGTVGFAIGDMGASIDDIKEAKNAEFTPHMMYDPKTGKGYKANTHADHLKMKDMGYTHEKPEVEEDKTKKKGNVTLNPELAEDGHTDVASAIRKCKTIIEDAQDIMTALQAVSPEDDLPTWWTNKMAVSANSLNSMRDYIKNPGTSKE